MATAQIPVTDVELAGALERARRLSFEEFPDCPWANTPTDGEVWTRGENAPDAGSLRCSIEVERADGGWHNIPTGEGVNKWSVDQCAERPIRERFGGRRRYRASIRWSGDTLKGTYRYFDLRENGPDPKPILGLPPESDPAFAASSAPTQPASAMERAPMTEPLNALDQLLAITRNDPGLAILTNAIVRLPLESQFVAAVMLFSLHEQRRMSGEVMAFSTDAIRLLAGRSASADVTEFWRSRAVEGSSRLDMMLAEVERLKRESGAPTETTAEKLAQTAMNVMGPVVAEKVMSVLSPDEIRGFIGALGKLKVG